mmetsp:Transcript_17154/g.39576  ORF Transcript_17154/g.39576 Transcript_17154/m.39576 type:complete len:162 (-) Transcript_17154:652-1137(-)
MSARPSAMRITCASTPSSTCGPGFEERGPISESNNRPNNQSINQSIQPVEQPNNQRTQTPFLLPRKVRNETKRNTHRAGLAFCRSRAKPERTTKSEKRFFDNGCCRVSPTHTPVPNGAWSDPLISGVRVESKATQQFPSTPNNSDNERLAPVRVEERHKNS